MTARRNAGIAALTAATLAAAYIGWFLVPEFRGLVKLCAYTVVSNVYISLLPHEPVLFYYTARSSGHSRRCSRQRREPSSLAWSTTGR